MNKHDTKIVNVHGKDEEIDINLVTAINILNSKFNLETHSSCEGTPKDGYILFRLTRFEHIEELFRLANLLWNNKDKYDLGNIVIDMEMLSLTTRINSLFNFTSHPFIALFPHAILRFDSSNLINLTTFLKENNV